MFRPFAEWLAKTPVSQVLQDHLWVVPTSQSIHIVALSMVFFSALIINMRLLGVGNSGRSISNLTQAMAPWIWRGLVVLLITGVTQTIAEPVRQFITPIFWGKMFLIVVVALLTLSYVRAVRSNAAKWDVAATRPASAKVFALVTTLIWLIIIVFGRFIGYVYQYYN